MNVRIENVIFDVKNNNFSITRGGRFVTGSFTEKGVPVVKLKGFGEYYFDPNTWQVFSRAGRKSFKILKKHVKHGKDFFWISINGIAKRVYAFEILRDNKDGIEAYFTDEAKRTIRA